MSSSNSELSLNLLFLVYDLETGGPELRLLDFAKYFPQQIKMHICVTSRKTSLLPDFLKAKAKIFILPVTRAYLEYTKSWQIYKYVKAEKISVVNAFAIKELFLATVLKAFSGWKIKIVYHHVETLDHIGIFQSVIFRILLKLTDRILCNSNYLAEYLKKFFLPTKKITIIHNGINIDFFERPFRKKNAFYPNLRKNVVCIGTIANFRKEKNYPFLIEAFDILSKNYPNLRLICVGGGSFLKRIKDLAQFKGIEKKILFTGYSKDIIKYLTLMDLFVLCSTREGFPNVLLQAMSMEIPTISANVGGCSEIIDHMKNGILYPSNNLKKFIQSVDILLKDESFSSKLAANGKETIRQNFSLGKMLTEYLDFYRKL